MAENLNQDMLCRQAAALIASGATHATIQQQLNLSRWQTSKLVNDPMTRQYVAEMGEEVTKTALIRIRQDVSKLAGLAMKALESNLKKNNMEAVKTLLRVVGALDHETQQAQDTNLTVIMPGAKTEQVLEVKGEELETPAPSTASSDS
jgi:hypothetical protein